MQFVVIKFMMEGSYDVVPSTWCEDNDDVSIVLCLI